MYPGPRLGGNRRQRWQALKKTYRKRGPQWARHAPQYFSQTQTGAAKEGSKHLVQAGKNFLTFSKDCL
jgi:hypothetical protein